ncbi:MAG: terminase small subunit [Candidatus Nanopelagicaceae bacterium]
MGSTDLKKYRLNKHKEAKLTDKERAFIAEYQVDYNATRAAKAAGYSEKTAQVTGAKLLSKPHIARAIGASQQAKIEKLELSAEEVLKQLYYCVTRSAKDFCDEEGKIITDVSKLNARACATIDGIEQDVYFDNEGNQHVKTKLKLVPKASAMDMAMKHKGLFAPTKIESKSVLNWDAIVEGVSQLPSMDDVVEQKLLEQEKALTNG